MTAVLVATGQADPPGRGRGRLSRPFDRPGYQPHPWLLCSRLADPHGLPRTGTRVAEALWEAHRGVSSSPRSLDGSGLRQQLRLTFTDGGSATTNTAYAKVLASPWRLS